MRESSETMTRIVTSALQPELAAKVPAQSLWMFDITQYVAFVHNSNIVTGRLKKIMYEKKDSRVSIMLVVDSEAYDVALGTDVWVAQDPFEVSITGLYVKERERR